MFLSPDKAFFARLLVLLLALSLTRCELEEEMRIEADGSGLYRAKMSLEKQLAAMLPDLRRDYEKKGFRVIEQRETEDRHVIVVERPFRDLSEIGDAQNRYAFVAADANWLQRRYEFRASIRGSQAVEGFSRQLTVRLPGRIERNSGGEVRGGVIVWDCSKGGSLEVTSVGLTSIAGRTVAIVAALIVGAILIAFLISRRRRNPMQPRCAVCGTPRTANGRFCASCGAADAPMAVEGSGG